MLKNERLKRAINQAFGLTQLDSLRSTLNKFRPKTEKINFPDFFRMLLINKDKSDSYKDSTIYGYKNNVLYDNGEFGSSGLMPINEIIKDFEADRETKIRELNSFFKDVSPIIILAGIINYDKLKEKEYIDIFKEMESNLAKKLTFLE